MEVYEAKGDIIAAARKCLLAEARKPNARVTVDEVVSMNDDRAVLEAMSTSDFPLLLADSSRTRLLQRYDSEIGPLTQLMEPELVSDFADHKGVLLGHMGQLQEIPDELTEGMKYTHVGESGKTYSAKAFGRRVKLTMKLLHSDKLGGLAKIPGEWGQIAAESLETHLATFLNSNLEQDGTTAVFSAARSNCGVLPLTEANLGTTIALLKAMTYNDADGTAKKITCKRVGLLVPDTLEQTAWKIWTATKYVPAAAAAGTEYDPKEIWRKVGLQMPITVPAFTDANRWMVVNLDRPWVKKVLHRQMQQPAFLQKRPYWDQNIFTWPVDESMCVEWGCFFPYGYFVEDYRTMYAQDSDNPW